MASFVLENTENWRSHDCVEEVPKKRRRRFVDKFSVSDDDEPQENIESTSLSSRSSSLIAFESLEKHCEDVLIGGGFSDASGFGKVFEAPRWTTISPDSPRESIDEFDSSDELSSSSDTLHRSHSLHGTLRSLLQTDTRMRTSRSMDSLNLYESTPPISYTLSELSQSHSALDYEKEKQQEQEYVIRDKKLTATTADLSTMIDPYDMGLKALSFMPRRRQDTTTFQYKESNQFRNFGSSLSDGSKTKLNFSPSKRKSYSAEALKLQLPQIEKNSKDQVETNHGRSEPCLSVPQKSHPSVENLSEDSGFDDHISSKGKMNLVNFRNSVSSIPEDEDPSPLETSSSNFSDSNGSEEGSVVSTEGRETSKILDKNIGSSKITEKQEPEVRGGITIEDDVDVKFNSGQSQTHIFNCTREKEGLFKRGEVENLIATPSVPFVSLASNESDKSVESVLKVSEFDAFHAENKLDVFNGTDRTFESKCFCKDELTVCKSLNDFVYENMTTKLEKNSADVGLAKNSRLPVLSTPNLLVGVEDFVRSVPSAASSLTHVPLKCYDEDDIDEREIRNNFLDFKKNQLSSGFRGSQNAGGIKGVHFCPVVSEVSWQDNYSEASTNASSDTSTDEISNRSLEELCEIQNAEEEFHEIEEKSIPRDGGCSSNLQKLDLSEERRISKFKSNSELNLSRIRRGDADIQGFCPSIQRKRNSEKSSGNPVTVEEQNKDSTHFNVNISSNGCEPCVEEKPVTPTICVTPTSSGHVLTGDAAQPNAERRTRLSVSESNLPAQGHASDDRFKIDNRAYSDHADASAKDMAMKKSKSRFGGFFERFSLRRLSSRKASNGGSKKQNGKKEEKREKGRIVGASAGNGSANEDVVIIPLHGPENEADVKEIFRSVVTPHVVSAKPPLPPSFQRMSGGSRKRLPSSGTVPVGLQDEEADGRENMPGVRESASTDNDSANGTLISTPCNVEPKHSALDKPVGLLETDLDTHITVESAGRRPLVQNNVGGNKKARSLMNLGLGDITVHHDQPENLPSGYLEPPTHRSHGSVVVDDRAKSMEFLLDKENQAAILVSI